MTLGLRPLTHADEARAIAAHDAMGGWDFLLGWEGQPWSDLLAQLENESLGRDLPEGRVPCDFLIAEVGDEIVGRLSFRHELNDWLSRYGGHLGYGVLPAHRGRGHATEILRQGLDRARDIGLERVLVTCDDDNLASAATIEKCGGVLQDRIPQEDGTLTRRYWIAL